MLRIDGAFASPACSTCLCRDRGDGLRKTKLRIISRAHTQCIIDILDAAAESGGNSLGAVLARQRRRALVHADRVLVLDSTSTCGWSFYHTLLNIPRIHGLEGRVFHGCYKNETSTKMCGGSQSDEGGAAVGAEQEADASAHRSGRLRVLQMMKTS